MDLQKSEELSRRFALLPIANHPNVPFAGPVIIDTHVPEASGAPGPGETLPNTETDDTRDHEWPRRNRGCKDGIG